jgi:hypothetical protein
VVTTPVVKVKEFKLQHFQSRQGQSVNIFNRNIIYRSRCRTKTGSSSCSFSSIQKIGQAPVPRLKNRRSIKTTTRKGIRSNTYLLTAFNAAISTNNLLPLINRLPETSLFLKHLPVDAASIVTS